MRAFTKWLTAVLFLSVTVTAVEAASFDLVNGNAAIATYQQVSADGCIVTSGELAVLSARQSENPSGVYVVGVRENVCTGQGDGFAGFATGQVQMIALGYARVTAVIEAETFSGNGPVTVDIDLAFYGTGAVTTDSGFFSDEWSLWFQFSTRRSAWTFGLFSLDGEEAELDSALLARQISGTLNR